MSQQAPATIKVLPARLANQIAAGEVVERPASVLKELLENSIDAGATQVDIDIEKGGHKKIKITDNGSGIAKEQLMLALSRHATSKVSELDDLENIHTLGFRGEALASISSVSRLTLTSRTAEQSEAWQARSEGRDMRVQVEPAAHPQGTSVEVLDLFFNTPARRKFLRTEKTEFNHIEELFNRIALSRYDVGLRLKHNGKLLKNLPAIVNAEPLKRIKQLCGASICDGLLQVDGQYQGFRLHGWVSGPGYLRAMNDIQFVFVNNRMMRDKLIFHAVRQAYEGLLPHDKFPYFMLYLEVPCSEVDVNVHPAKHEVRFHQSRLVHDFIFSALNDALNDAMQPKLDSSEVATETVQPEAESDLFGAPANSETELKPEVRHSYRSENESSQQASGDVQQASGHSQPDTDYITPLQPAQHNGSGKGYYRPEPAQQIKEAASQYTRLMTVPLATDSIKNDETFPVTQGSKSLAHDGGHSAPDSNTSDYQDSSHEVAASADILQVQGRGLLLRWQQEYFFMGQRALLKQYLEASLSAVSQPLLVPVSLKITGVDIDEDILAEASKTGIELHWTGKKLILKKVPAGTREQNWQLILNELIELKTADPTCEVLMALARHWKVPEPESAAQSALSLWLQMDAQQHQTLMEKYAVKVPLLDWLVEQGE